MNNLKPRNAFQKTCAKVMLHAKVHGVHACLAAILFALRCLAGVGEAHQPTEILQALLIVFLDEIGPLILCNGLVSLGMNGIANKIMKECKSNA